MADALRLRFERLGPHHDRDGFSCGEPSLDRYLKRQATQDDRRNLARCFVAVRDGEPEIVGYYSLSSLSIVIDDLPAELARKLPRYEGIPAALIGRLARHGRYRGQAVGELLLADAVTRIMQAGERMAVHAIVVDALNDAAAEFYRRFGFRPQVSRPSRLFLPMATAIAAFREPP